MTRLVTAAALLALLAACDDDQPLNFDGETPTTPPTTPTDGEDPLNPDELPPVNGVFGPVAGDLDAGSFSTSGGGTLQVSITLDDDVLLQTYTRNAAYDVPGYLAFTTQDDALDRFFTAFGATSNDGDVQAVLAMDGGQFTKYFGGVTYSATDYTAPSSGLASYAGTYVGMSNFGTRDGTLPSGANPDILPERATRVTGDVFINADFTDNTLNGAIYGRTSLDGSPVGVDTVFLVPTGINADGSFTGGSENRAQENIGSYSGTFGGTNASGIAGGVFLEEFDEGVENEQERGMFVLNQCGTPGEAAICNDEDVDDVDED